MKQLPLASVAAAALLMIITFCVAGIEAPAPGGYDLSWNTIDGGGAMFSTGGGYELGGTIGQPDAGVQLTGGTFTLTGGFWPGAGPAINTCPADIAPSGGDGVVNTADLLLVINTWGACAGCPADIAPTGPPMGDGIVNTADLLFVINHWGPCP